MKWIVIVRSCAECGGLMAFEIFDDKPTPDQINQIKNEIGGMDCITEYFSEIKDGINKFSND